jgi:hypothetical protein
MILFAKSGVKTESISRIKKPRPKKLQKLTHIIEQVTFKHIYVAAMFIIFNIASFYLTLKPWHLVSGVRKIGGENA